MINIEKKTTIKKGRDDFGRPAWLIVQDDRTITAFPEIDYATTTSYQLAIDYVSKQ